MKPVLLLLLLLCPGPALAREAVVCPADASARMKFAAHEVRRYVYLRTGKRLAIMATGHGIALRVDPLLDPQQYRLKTEDRTLTISGGSDVGVLYGAYAYAERLGVRFEIDRDIIPDQRLQALPAMADETAQPLFELRGLQPFHDFPEGPDWWTVEDWKFILGQSAKLRFNFVGLHTYPAQNRDLGPEPTVWIGVPEDVNPDGTVKLSDEASWYTTAKTQPYGCYQPGKTSDYSFGGAQVFPTDDYGSEVNGPEDFPFPKTPAARVALINRTGRMLQAVFHEAHRLGMKTCVGTESPLDIPGVVKDRLAGLGLLADDPAAIQKVFAGMFTRIQRAFPIDYYWIWGHEGEIDQKRFITNLECAQAALRSTQASFGLGICGWGWITGNFPALDQALPKNIVFSAISMNLGSAPVSENFARLEGRTKWSIPWFEDDPTLTSIQLRAGRMRRDAVDARRYGCQGLMGLHWRTRILSPTIGALAQAAWEQGSWSRPAPAAVQKPEIEVFGGQTAAFLNHAVDGTDLVPLYQTVRYNLRGYRFAVPDGRYRVTLRFVEPAYQQAGKRVFGIQLQQQPVVEHLDIFARVGAFRALDLTFTNLVVDQGQLRIEFVPEVEYPCIAAIELAGSGVVRKLNCGGPACQDYAADPGPADVPRDLPVADFYAAWARAQFGPEAGPEAAAIFSRLDGQFPVTSTWNRGPGVIAVQSQPWASLAKQFGFVDEFAQLRPRVVGAGNRERFDWWLNTFRVTRAMGQLGCARGELDALVARLEKETDPAVRRELARERALPLRLAMVSHCAEMYSALLATLNNATELGTLANFEQQSLWRVKILEGQDPKLEQFLGVPLPETARPWKDYRGPPQVTVLTARTSVARGEALPLRIVALDAQPPGPIRLHYRPLGQGRWQSVRATHLARAIYQVSLPPATEDFEYYVEAAFAGHPPLRWPVTAPDLPQTAVVID